MVIRVKASKLTTHEPDDFDESYVEWVRGQVEEKLDDLKFHKYLVTVEVERDP